ncbi:MAG: hypothetical protein Q8764_00135 [Pigeon pea little leaf phytoplasma]|uniref:Effector n=1 Tax=Candidatus Phytoplasma fabacearum TaxID=2982628 RepID=A0ABU8ZS35_9MOLU|nr:hypothetical protein ['Bituminaria bituminosa' little leaf phytoplasma]MDV3148802.1 hypothetical protein [Pigeon pea little leaf phytoplasma]MDO7983472.1 hypothetical protein ['Bituminaria bituminosa' little leaf phytoplasma]MDO8023789.1 hypothetical protein ['Bituminaria bituminosa' little leaf phytoplasma]MDO8030392.1 hypothetical protein ['Bituminaria bituminosa' little leaf phytoplasma]MDV3154002.1 hypothetical protein [Pigeon pea little leaf phytoplasma]
MFFLMIIGLLTFIFLKPINTSFMFTDSKENLTSGNISSEEVPRIDTDNENLINLEEKNNHDDLDYASLKDYNSEILADLSNSEIKEIIGESETPSEVLSVTRTDDKKDIIQTNVIKSKSKIRSFFKPFRNIRTNLKKLKKFNSTNNLVNHNFDFEPDYATITKNKNLEKMKNLSAINFHKVIETPEAIC